MNGVEASWAAVVGHLRQSCPAVAAQIRPPARDELLRRAEAAVGGPLPDELARWWRLADGVDGRARIIPHLQSPSPVEAALRDREVWLQVSEDMAEYPPEEYEDALRAEAGTPCEFMFLPQWLPIAQDGMGASLFVDLRPGPRRGCVGEFLKDGWAFEEPVWPGVGAMLADIAAALTDDGTARGFRPWLDEEGLSWDHDAWRWSMGGSRAIDGPRLRQRYADLAAQLRAGGFGPPPAGAWSAGQVAEHVRRNAELLLATTEAIAAADPALDRRMAEAYGRGGRGHPPVEPVIRYDNRPAMDPPPGAGADLPALAGEIERLADRLVDAAHRLGDRRPLAYAHVVDGRTLIDDACVGWWGVLWAQCLRQLPLRTRQLRRLRP